MICVMCQCLFVFDLSLKDASLFEEDEFCDVEHFWRFLLKIWGKRYMPDVCVIVCQIEKSIRCFHGG